MVDAAPQFGEGNRPLHVAVIMDGNGRWARARGMPRGFGHREGAKAVRRAVEAACDLGVGYLTLFGFSSENWSRPAQEIGDLMELLRFYLRREIADLHNDGIRFQVIGDRSQLSADIVTLIENGERLTAGNTRMVLTIALSYGGRHELTGAVRRIAEDVRAGRLDPSGIDEAVVASRLDTASMPDPDLLIRTSGEQRISNFLLWQIAYTEFVFLDVLWPDFGRADLEGALDEFARRDRRFGRASGQGGA